MHDKYVVIWFPCYSLRLWIYNEGLEPDLNKYETICKRMQPIPQKAAENMDRLNNSCQATDFSVDLCHEFRGSLLAHQFQVSAIFWASREFSAIIVDLGSVFYLRESISAMDVRGIWNRQLTREWRRCVSSSLWRARILMGNRTFDTS